MTQIIIFVLIALSALVLYTIINRLNQESEDTFVPTARFKKFKPAKPLSSGASSGPAKPLGKIEEPSVKSETVSAHKPIKADAKVKAKKAAAKKTKKPKNNGDQLLHS